MVTITSFLESKLASEVKFFVAARSPFPLSIKWFAAAKRLARRKKKMPTRFYKKREHTAEGFNVHRSGSSTSTSYIFVLPTKIFSFSFERVLDYTYKVYEIKESQTLNFGSYLIVFMQLGFDGFI